MDIDNICKAMNFYKALGFEEIQVPWIVPRDVTKSTCPDDAFIMPTVGGDLVGSGEQGFVDLARRGLLPNGRLVTNTPCFRNEADEDYFHQKYFMKVELFSQAPDLHNELEVMSKMALDLFQTLKGKYTDRHQVIYNSFKRIETEEGYDIVMPVDGFEVEVGSYGIRSFEDIWWVYGTGLAEPRYSRLMTKIATDLLEEDHRV